MRLPISIPCLLMACFVSAAGASANGPGPWNVPPTEEIEVLDPGVDPLGRPAVVVERDGLGNARIDIPPAILVHRFYYTGDRSFQAQLLPGGPSIVVANHPVTGERCYVNVQMLPGAPRVIYQRNQIEYDYGEFGITLCFPKSGGASVSYRSGRTAAMRVGEALNVDQWDDKMENFVDHSKYVAVQSHTMVKGAALQACDATKVVTQPLVNFTQMIPFVKPLCSDLGERLSERAREYDQQKALDRYERQLRQREATVRTYR